MRLGCSESDCVFLDVTGLNRDYIACLSAADVSIPASYTQMLDDSTYLTRVFNISCDSLLSLGLIDPVDLRLFEILHASPHLHRSLGI